MFSIYLDGQRHDLKGESLATLRKCVDSVKSGKVSALRVGNNARPVKQKSYSKPTLLLVGQYQTERITGKKLDEFERKLSSVEAGNPENWGEPFSTKHEGVEVVIRTGEPQKANA